MKTAFCSDFPCIGSKGEALPDIQPNTSEGEPIEINYDTVSLTYVYQAIEGKAFMAAIDFLESNKPEVYDECRTWVTRYELRNPKKICWSQLPLHTAIVFGGPIKLIELLVQKYPRACRCTDDQSMLPIHLAFRFASSDAILWALIREFPEALNAKDNKGRYPLELASQGEAWKKGKIISFSEKNAKQMVVKTESDQRVQNAEAALNTQLMKNAEMAQTTQILKEENEQLKTKNETSANEIGKLEAQKNHLNKLRMAKRKVVKKVKENEEKEEETEQTEQKVQKVTKKKKFSWFPRRKKVRDNVVSKEKMMSTTSGDVEEIENAIPEQPEEVVKDLENLESKMLQAN